MTETSKIKLRDDDYVLVRMAYDYYVIPKWAYTKDNSKGMKQQILKNQKMIEELHVLWNDGKHGMFAENVTETMEKYFGKRT